ncbi:MAG: DUF455 family protein [Leptospiraceae bacterium]|nr:DUF455 family protein [Leptospiraceae bacterium]MCP5498479.1 DUF455 family protein [Leptospiraceae bacterium]
MKTINEYCLHLLSSPSLKEKLLPAGEELLDIKSNVVVPEKPGREKKLSFSDKKMKIPRLEHLKQADLRAITLHHFANHELMAIELFAYALLKFQDIPELNRREMLKTIADEQKHLKLYLQRIEELGMQFGDRELNYIFWKYTPKMQTKEKFAAIMSLSFEGANLDYSLLYKETFLQYGDPESASIMDVIYKDELKHVRRGLKIIKKEKPEDISDWDYYLSLLDYPFTPRRAKGYVFIPETRKKAGFSEDFIEKLSQYKDEFSNRKPEKIPREILDNLFL